MVCSKEYVAIFFSAVQVIQNFGDKYVLAGIGPRTNRNQVGLGQGMGLMEVSNHAEAKGLV